jgi:hypothetical protein
MTTVTPRSLQIGSVDVVVDPVNEQDDRLDCQPEQCGQVHTLGQFSPLKAHICRPQLPPAKDDQTEDQNVDQVGLQGAVDQTPGTPGNRHKEWAGKKHQVDQHGQADADQQVYKNDLPGSFLYI